METMTWRTEDLQQVLIIEEASEFTATAHSISASADATSPPAKKGRAHVRQVNTRNRFF
jgi:hypothetical protein